MPDEKPASDRILLRRATAEDIPLLSAIEAECLEQPWSRTSLAQLLSNESAVCIAAVRQETVIGYGSMYCIADEGSINNIAVLPAFRRMGIGARILGELVSARKTPGRDGILAGGTGVKRGRALSVFEARFCGKRPSKELL